MTKQPRNIQPPRRLSCRQEERVVLLEKRAGAEAVGHPKGGAGSNRAQPLPFDCLNPSDYLPCDNGS